MGKELNDIERGVIVDKATERPFSGKYNDFDEKGLYVCRRCGAPLYRSEDKFSSGCGWPSFEDEVKGAIKRIPDADGQRTEIVCTACGAHLGHVFEGEGLTPKNLRHCVNSLSLDFIPAEDIETAIFAGGCFWGVQYLMDKTQGVIMTEVGYIGGTLKNPTYKQVCVGDTGHIEALKVAFDKKATDFETLAKLFFEIHDFTQADGQGPDIGMQYVSRIFYTSDKQKKIAEAIIKELERKNYKVTTQLIAAGEFWPAEDYHQQYYEHKGSEPYCHARRKIF